MSLSVTQEDLERALRAAVDDLNRPQAENLCTALETRFERCSAAPLTFTCSYPARSWGSNRIGRLHGGAVSAMVDQAMGLLCFGGVGRVPPTVELQVSFLRPAALGGRLFICSTANSTGRSFWHLTCTAWMEDAPDKPVATASGVYFAGEYRK